MIKAEYSRGKFLVRLNKLGIHRLPISLLFDTGAIVTAISARQLYPEKDMLWFNRAKETLSSEYVAKPLYTINKEEILGFPTWLCDVYLSGTLIHKFYYYIVFGTEGFKSVLGNDFIDCCNFSHSPSSDILINSFDPVSYESNWQKNFGQDKIISSTELCCLLEQVDVSESSASNDRVSQMEVEMKKALEDLD